MVHRPEWLANTELQDPEVDAELAHVDFDQPNIGDGWDRGLRARPDLSRTGR